MIENLKILLENKVAFYTVAFITSGIGINIILRLINKIPLDKLYAVLEASAKGASVAGNMKFTKPLWEPLETFFQKALSGAVDAINRGLDSDDNDPQPKPEEVKPETKTEEVKNV